MPKTAIDLGQGRDYTTYSVYLPDRRIITLHFDIREFSKPHEVLLELRKQLETFNLGEA